MEKEKKYIKKAIEVHNSYYSYPNFDFKNIRDKVNIECPQHGEFSQRLDAHLNGQGCPKCKGGIKKNFRYYEHRFKIIHKNKYIYNEDSFKGSRTKMNIICQIHGEFKQAPTSHLKGHGCPNCGFEKVSKQKILTTKDFTEKANIVHNNKFNYEKTTYLGTRNKVIITCSEHGDFSQSPNDHLSSKGCLKCSMDESKGENELYEYIKSLNIDIIERKNRDAIPPKEIDIFLPEKNIGFEYCGLYWHSDLFKNKNYHFNKNIQANNKHINLITIFEDEWINKRPLVERKIKNIIGISDDMRVFARKCIIKEIENHAYKNFLQKNHIQGYITAKIKIGLFYEGILVAVIGFRRINGGWDLSRFATSCNVIGGFSKLLKHFTDSYNPSKIITFADLRYSNIMNNLYKNNGFNYERLTEPNFFYFKGNIRYSRNKFQKHKLKKVLENYDAELSAHQNMVNNGYKRIFDCGNIKYSLSF